MPDSKQENQINTNLENLNVKSDYPEDEFTIGFNKALTKKSDIYNRFNPYRLEDNEEPFIKGIPIIFMTKPSLNLVQENVACSSFMVDLYASDSDIFDGLASTISGPYRGSNDKISEPFIPIITNKFKEINLKDLSLRTKEIHETYSGYKQMVPTSYIESITGDDLSIKYSETKNLGIIKTHKLWLEYIEKVRRGMMKPTEDSLMHKYIDYTSSIYYFLLDFDMETILFYSKYTGVIPTSIPYSSFGGDITSKELVDVDINYVYSYKEDLEPEIIIDFNAICDRASDVFNKSIELNFISGENLINEENTSVNEYKDLYDDNENFLYKNVKIVRHYINNDDDKDNIYHIGNSFHGTKKFVYKLKFYNK